MPVAQRTVAARREGFEQLLEWGRRHEGERSWVIEDVRHVSGSLERFLLDHGETVVRLAPQLMAGARQGMRERGKSDPIDALAIARAALREGLETLPSARLTGPELEVRLLGLHRERLVRERTRLINELRWQLHDLWPDWLLAKRVLIHPAWQVKVVRRLQAADPAQVRVRIARDMIRRVRELTRTINDLYQQLASLVRELAPQLLAQKGIGVLIAAKLIGEIGGIERFQTDAQLARLAGCAPIPVSSDHRPLPPGSRRQPPAQPRLPHARAHPHQPRPPNRPYIAKQRATGKTNPEAIRCLKRHLVRRVYHLLRDPTAVPTTICLT